MKNKNKYTIAALLSLGLVLAACQKDAANTKTTEDTKAETKVEEAAKEEKPAEEAEKPAEEVSMADWEGEWNDMGGYLEKPEIQEAYKT